MIVNDRAYGGALACSGYIVDESVRTNIELNIVN